MITLLQLAYQFIDDMSGGAQTSDSKLDERDVILKIRQIMNEIMVLKYFEKYQEGDRSAISLYISTYELTLEKDANRNITFVTIPEFYAQLPYNRGIHRAWLKQDSDEGEFNDIVISHQPAVSSKLRAGNVPGIKYGYLEGFKLVLRNVQFDKTPQKAFIQLIIAAPDSIGINDPLPVVPEQQSEIYKRLMAIYRPVPQDLTNNANPNR